jgi:hypothetical protein
VHVCVCVYQMCSFYRGGLSSVPAFILTGKETIVQIDIHTNIYIETNPPNIPWNTDR